MKMDKDEQGRIAVAPLTSFGLVLVAEMACILRLEFARTPDQLKGTPESIQLVLTPEQAFRLADALKSTAGAALVVDRTKVTPQ